MSLLLKLIALTLCLPDHLCRHLYRPLCHLGSLLGHRRPSLLVCLQAQQAFDSWTWTKLAQTTNDATRPRSTRKNKVVKRYAVANNSVCFAQCPSAVRRRQASPASLVTGMCHTCMLTCILQAKNVNRQNTQGYSLTFLHSIASIESRNAQLTTRWLVRRYQSNCCNCSAYKCDSCDHAAPTALSVLTGGAYDARYLAPELLLC